MRKRLLWLWLWLSLGVVLSAGCAAGSSNPVSSSLGDNFELHVGQSAIVGTEGLEVGFDSVSSDSRCPRGETCVWEGDAIVRVWLQRSDGTRQSLELHTASSEEKNASYDGYSIELVSLDPPAASGRSIAPTEYVATFKVTTGVAGGEALSLRSFQTAGPAASMQ